MMKIVASLIILGLCANVCFGAPAAPADTTPTQITTSSLNTTFTKVFSAANSSDAAKWDSSTAGSTGPPAVPAAAGGVNSVIFGPGATNDTSYVYGLVYGTGSAAGTIATIVKRTVNNTVVSWANDTMEACIQTADSSITSGQSNTGGQVTAVAPGYLAILSSGTDTNNEPQVYLSLVSSSSTPYTLTKNTDTTTPGPTVTGGSTGNVCTQSSVSLGNIWYDIGAGAFFYTYSITQQTDAQSAIPSGSTSWACGVWASSAISIYLGGYYTNGSAYWSADLKLTPSVASPKTSGANAPSGLKGGGDNWLNSSNIYVVYKDGTAATTYVSHTAKASTTTAGSFSTLIADPTTTATLTQTYYPLSVWSSNNTYGIAVSNSTMTTPSAGGTSTYSYTITNFLNGTTTGTDSGLSCSSCTASGDGVFAANGWQLNTGYSLIGGWYTGTAATVALGTFYANGTVNSTQTTLFSSVEGIYSIYEDVNGTLWIGWTDPDSANEGYTYAGYLAILQGQLNVGANILATLSAFCALFLASIFAF